MEDDTTLAARVEDDVFFAAKLQADEYGRPVRLESRVPQHVTLKGLDDCRIPFRTVHQYPRIEAGIWLFPSGSEASETGETTTYDVHASMDATENVAELAQRQ